MVGEVEEEKGNEEEGQGEKRNEREERVRKG